MVWTAVGLGVAWVVLVGAVLWQRDGLIRWKEAHAAELIRANRLEVFWDDEASNRRADNSNLSQSLLAERSRADKYESAYNDLRTRLEAKAAAKPADAIIHAKNSGDVRRAWDAAMANEEQNRTKELEN